MDVLQQIPFLHAISGLIMPIPAAFTAVVLIWATTPLAIQWSGRDVSFLFGLSSRMVIGLVILLALHLLLRKPIPLDSQAQRVYLAGGLGLFTAMTCVYWAAQYMPSGWISVIFGLTPIATGVMATIWLNEKTFTAAKLFGKILGITGLAIMLLNKGDYGVLAPLGIMLVLASVLSLSASTVWVKRLGADIDGMTVTTGSLLVATPLYLITWQIFDGHWPQSIPLLAVVAIVYLGVFGSVIGFVLYYYLLRRISAHQTVLITLITPVIALWLGHWLNNEIITPTVIVGTGLILLSLLSHEFGDSLLLKLIKTR